MFLQPDDIKSCANCKLKKVKCTGEIPQCSRCVKASIQCNMAENVYYNHKTVKSLLEVIERLKQEVTRPRQNLQLRSNNDNLLSSTHQREQEQKLSSQYNGSPYNAPSIAILARKHTFPTPKYLSSVSTFSGSTSPTSETSINSPEKKEKGKKRSTIESISTEVGSLTLPDEDFVPGKTSTRSRFPYLILKQLNLDKQSRSMNSFDDAFECFDASVCRAYTPLPPYRVAKFAVQTYINCVHVCFPFLSVTDLKNILEKMYTLPREVSSQDKFILFLVLSIGLDKGENSPEMANYKNQFDPVEYYNTAYRYLEEILTIRSEKTLQALLLTIIWLLHVSVVQNNSGDIWHLGRFSLSVAMELGCHRYNPDWDFGELKNELRNRLFWSTYVLERTIAMRLKRGVSLRKQAIDTPKPKLYTFDSILDDNFFVSRDLNIYEQVQFKPALLWIKLCEVYGDILETLYLVSGTGPREYETYEARLDFKEQTNIFLENWITQVEKEIPKRTHVYHELRILYGLASINLHRKTPGLPDLNDGSIIICKEKCRGCIDSYIWLLQDGWKLAPLHISDIVDIGLLVIYCCWKLDANSENLKELSVKLMKIINEIVRLHPDFTKFKNLYIILSCIIIEDLDSEYRDPTANNVTGAINQLRASTYYLPSVSDSKDVPYSAAREFYAENGVKINDWFSHELFKDVFRQYYFQADDPTMKEVSNLFCIDD